MSGDEVTGVLAVVAHPDDESFGLGGVPAELITRRAVDAHRSQSLGNAVLYRRLELLDDREYLRLIHPSTQPGRNTTSCRTA